MECLDCGFQTNKTANWKRHLNSKKHLVITGFTCSCGNIYLTKTQLHRHEKSCKRETVQESVIRFAQEQAERDAQKAKETAKEKVELITMFNEHMTEREQKHTAEMKTLYADMVARPASVTNNTFNLAFFLNETCKNAQTIEQFMGSIPLLMNSDQSLGQYILDNLNKCAVEDRPIHCTDLKRGKLAVKNSDNVWEQDQTKVDPLVNLNVNTLRQRYLRDLSNVWCPDHPHYETEDKTNTEWIKLITMMCADLDEKFLNHIAKVTTIPKDFK